MMLNAIQDCQEEQFHEGLYDHCIQKIAVLQRLIALEERKLFAAMKKKLQSNNAKK